MIEEPSPRLEVRVQPDATMAVLVVEGEIDLEAAERFDRALVNAAGPDAARRVVVDLSAVEYIDSSGFRALHRAARRGTVVLVVPDDSPVARAVGIAGLPTLMSVFASVDSVRPEP